MKDEHVAAAAALGLSSRAVTAQCQEMEVDMRRQVSLADKAQQQPSWDCLQLFFLEGLLSLWSGVEPCSSAFAHHARATISARATSLRRPWHRAAAVALAQNNAIGKESH
jgi:hypothetical protein